MALEITKTFVVKASPAAVWAFLIDPERVVRCMPGAAIGQRLDERSFTGSMTVKVGPVTSSYKGKVIFEKLDAEKHRAEIVATGQDIRGKGGADMRMTSTLVEKSAGETEVTAVSKVNITGILAQMGRGMIQDVSDQLFQIFSKKMREELEAEAAKGEAAAKVEVPAPKVEAAAPKVEAPAAEVVDSATSGPPTAASPPTATSHVATPEPAPAPTPTVANAAEAPTPTPARATDAPRVASSAPAAPEVLDLTAIGTKAFGRAMLRTLTQPWFLMLVVAVVLLVYWFGFHRSHR